MTSYPFRRFILAGFMLAGLFMTMMMLMGNLARATMGPTPFHDLKSKAWSQHWPPSIARGTARAPGRLQQIGLFPQNSLLNLRPTDRWTEMVFQTYKDNNHSWDIYTFHPGPYYNNARAIIVQPGADFSPSLNFNASEIVFVSNRDGNAELYRANIETLQQQRLTSTEANETAPAWSPAGNDILFTRVVDGQEEIYRMGIGGWGVTRLTTNQDRDLSPSWSPDGQRIVWTKRQGETAALWIMNADGSAPHAITPALPYLQNPRWSPQGDRIAFDYDADGDGYNELALINPDGSDLHVLFDARTEGVDLWLGAWSPEGDRVAFSEVLYIINNDTLFIQDAMIGYLEVDTQKFVIFNPLLYDLEMLPDWRKMDHQAPTSTMSPLPDPSPGPIQVAWQGQDRGPSGIAGYDVQVREDDEDWKLWLDQTSRLSDYYPGVGGHRYAFRVRARDLAGNVEPWPPQAQVSTTVETQPPHSEMVPLQPYERANPLLQWDGSDVGGSHIANFDVQYREGRDGVWTDWLTKTYAVSARFPAQTGIHYFFRVRARDTAQNVEPWPPGDGDTSTIVYGWKLDGTVTDMREHPLKGVSPLTVPPGFEVHPTDASGVFTVYGHSGVNSLTATWQKTGFGTLPLSRYATDTDIHVNMTLPPPDNQIQDGDFEAPGLTPSWTVSDQEVAPITSTWHSGAASLRMGCNKDPLAPLESIPDTEAQTYTDMDKKKASRLAVEDTGKVHVLWVQPSTGNEEKVFYLWRSPSGEWSSPEPIFETPIRLNRTQMLVDHQGRLHVILVATGLPSHIWYLTRPRDGEWHIQKHMIFNNTGYPDAAMALDSQGTIHLVWTQEDHLYYASHTPDGSWSEEVQLPSFQPPYFPHGLQILIGRDRRVQVAWIEDGRFYHLVQTAAGKWPASPKQIQIHGRVFSYAMESDEQGGTHFLIIPEANLYYLYLRPDGTYGTPLRVDNGHPYLDGYTGNAALAVSPSGHVHLVWGSRHNSQSVFIYLQKKTDGHWAQEQLLPYYGAIQRWLVDNQERLHLVWKYNGQVDYVQGDRQGNWSRPIRVLTVPHLISLVRVETQNLPNPRQRLHFLIIDHLPGVPLQYRATHYDTWPAHSFVASQSVRVPQIAFQPTLSFYVDFDQVAGTQPNTWKVQIDDGTQATTPLSLTTTTAGWQHIWLDMTPWAGQRITLGLQLRQTAASLCVQAYVDDVMLGSTQFPDLWIAAASDAPAAGGQVHQRIVYGNTGAAPAMRTVVTTTLPPPFRLLSAAPMPIREDNHTLRWELGDLPPGHIPLTIIYTATVASDASGILSQTFHIRSEAPEGEITNNDAILYTFINGFQQYLPYLN